ncbi:hypothetical protein K435DRAFT_972486 [Dendrothele bispora CBS 962.96]|uniref:Uncharacterized protein n=1 Tax=Dendrothele bispora (strain CBS 962.96) TaxID=1314807 RepID=A0A4S8KYE1_DENBC|nr:hypothetical protein K435DRAFT_972486 [Dendrothele bispora CBS 962.96]
MTSPTDILLNLNSPSTQPASAQSPESITGTLTARSVEGYRAPGIERVNKRLPPDKIEQEMRSRRFNIAVDSVYYYSVMGGTDSRCAVLLTTNLDLRDSDKFAFARVPLVATSDPNLGSRSSDINTENGPSVGFFEHFPVHDEYLEVRRKSGTKDIYVKPTLRVDVIGAGAELSGVGRTEHQNLDKSYCISLKSTKFEPANAPRTIQWTYEDQNAVFYPHTIQLLVIVNKIDRSSTSVLFPFDLTLKKDLVVELHSHYLRGIWDSVVRLIGKPMNHEGWRFRIKGNYKCELVKAALHEARNIDLSQSHPTLYGLHAGATSWIRAQTTGFVLQSANRPSEASINESQSSTS